MTRSSLAYRPVMLCWARGTLQGVHPLEEWEHEAHERPGLCGALGNPLAACLCAHALGGCRQSIPAYAPERLHLLAQLMQQTSEPLRLLVRSDMVSGHGMRRSWVLSFRTTQFCLIPCSEAQAALMLQS